MHPYLEECSSKDDFQRRGASCFERMLFWGLLFREEIILFQKNPLSGMIFHRRMHPVSEKSSHRDDFPQKKSSCFRGILSQGCFSTAEIILFQRNPLSGMLLKRRMHPVSGKYPLRDASMIKMLSHKAPEASHSHKGRKHMKYIHIHPLDNVAVALEDLKKGDLISVTAKAPAEIQSTEAPAGLPSAQAPAGIQKAASVEGTSEPAKSAVSSPSSTAAGRSRSSRMA